MLSAHSSVKSIGMKSHHLAGVIIAIHFCAAFLAIICLAGSPVHAGVAAADLASLQGAWDYVSVMDEGISVEPDGLVGAQVVFTGDKMTLVSPDRKVHADFSIALDPAKTPKTIDVTWLSVSFNGHSNKGIYDLKGDILRICQPEKPTQPRPTSFAAPEGFGLNLVTLKKSQK
jgi:uncharacterized protein (TIGR03067 family)